MYSYCGNNPTNFVDPTGHRPIVGDGNPSNERWTKKNGEWRYLGDLTSKPTMLNVAHNAGGHYDDTGGLSKDQERKISLKKNTNRKIKEIEKEKKTINDIWNSSKLSLDAAESHIDIIATLDNDIGLVRDGKERLSKLVLEQIDLNDKKGDDKPAIQYMKRAINYYCGDYNDFNITQVKLLNFVREEEIFKTYIEGQLVYDPSVVTMYDYMWVEGKRNNGNYVFDTAYFLLAAGSAVN